MTRSLPTKYKNTGLELVVAGSVTLLFNYLFTHLAFMILIGYGFYHILRTRTYPIGVTFLILGVVMWFLSHTIQFMFWVIGLLLLCSGIVSILSKRDER